jgi:prephenate dehydrogenase
MWEIAGSEVILMDTAKHDRVVAAISHLPHMVAYSLVNAVGEYRGCDENILKYSAGGFRDFTRIASSDPVMWRDIAVQNRQGILEMMDLFAAYFSTLREFVANGDSSAMEKFFSSSKGYRDALMTASGETDNREPREES